MACSSAAGETIGCSNVDLPMAFWKALCSHSSQSSKGRLLAASSEGDRGGEEKMASAILLVLGLLTSGPFGYALVFLWWDPQKVTELALCGQAHLRGARRQTHPGDWLSGACIWKPSPRLCQFSGHRKGSPTGARCGGAGRFSWERSLVLQV